MTDHKKTSVRRAAAWLCSGALALTFCHVLISGAARQPQLPTVQVPPMHTQRDEIAPLPTLTEGEVQVNAASAKELEALYGVGPAYAQAILEERETNGPFYFPEDLLAVKGIGPKRLEGFLQQLNLSIGQ